MKRWRTGVAESTPWSPGCAVRVVARMKAMDRASSVRPLPDHPRILTRIACTGSYLGKTGSRNGYLLTALCTRTEGSRRRIRRALSDTNEVERSRPRRGGLSVNVRSHSVRPSSAIRAPDVHQNCWLYLRRTCLVSGVSEKRTWLVLDPVQAGTGRLRDRRWRIRSDPNARRES